MKNIVLESWPCQLIEYDYTRVGDTLALASPEHKADLVFADPPYNLGVKYADDPTGDKMTLKEYQNFTLATLSCLIGVARPGATLWWMTPEEHADWTGDMLTRMVGPRLYRIVWWETFSQYQGDRALTKDYRFIFVHRVTASQGEVTFNPESIRVPSLRQRLYKDKRANPKGRLPSTTWEFEEGTAFPDMAALVQQMLLTAQAKGASEQEQREIIAQALAASARLRYVPGDIWKFRRLQGTSLDRVDWHPCQLPPELLQRIVKGWSNPGDLVLDAFAGSGSLAKVCKALGRRFIGVDRSPTYIERMAKELA